MNRREMERFLQQYGCVQDTRPDHREWEHPEVPGARIWLEVRRYDLVLSGKAPKGFKTNPVLQWMPGKHIPLDKFFRVMRALQGQA